MRCSAHASSFNALMYLNNQVATKNVHAQYLLYRNIIYSLLCVTITLHEIAPQQSVCLTCVASEFSGGITRLILWYSRRAEMEFVCSLRTTMPTTMIVYTKSAILSTE